MRFASAAFNYEVDGTSWHVVWAGDKVKLWTAITPNVFVVDNAKRTWKRSA